MTALTSSCVSYVKGQNNMTDSYRELKKIAPDLYCECVESAGAISINNNLPLKVGAEIESAMVELALKIKKEK